MIYHVTKKGINPIKAKAERINNKVIIETQYKNPHLADIALALWVDVHKKKKYEFTVEVKNTPRKGKPSRMEVKPKKRARIMGLPIKLEKGSELI